MLNSFVHAESLEDEVQRLQTYPSSYVKQLLSQGQDLAELASVGKVKEIALTLSTLREVNHLSGFGLDDNLTLNTCV